MSDGDDAPLLFEHRAKNGEILQFDISRHACDPFGFYYSDRVDTPNGPASVVGVHDKCLWFLVDGDRGASYWDQGKSYETLLSLGIALQEVIPEKKGYKVKTISFKNKNVSVVLQNENGPCPLLGISNVLALRGDISIEGEGSNKNIVTIENLQAKLASHLLAKNVHKGEEAIAIVDKASKIMPQLQFGLDVNFNFKEIDKFEQTEQCKLFELFGIRLVHGWLVDPEDLHVSSVFGANTYNDLMNKLVALDVPVPTTSPLSPPNQQSTNNSNNANNANTEAISQEGEAKKKPEEPPKPPTEQDIQDGIVINGFLNSTQSQLTPVGLFTLQSSLSEGELCVFFRNNHFSTLTKNDGKLYILVTDIGYERERNIVWDLLANVDGNSVFCDGDFRSAEQVNRDEVINTLDLMGFTKEQIEDCMQRLSKEELSNADNAISRAVSYINGKPGSDEVQVL